MLYAIFRAIFPEYEPLSDNDRFQLDLVAANGAALKEAEEDRFFSKGTIETKWPRTLAWIDERKAKGAP